MPILRDEVNVTVGKNKGLNEDIIIRFVSAEYFELVEWWLKEGIPYPPRVMAEQVGELVERI
ncbi:TetR-like C-terminal domain-containing protein [Neobacillus cucumis]|uniref:TetR-like C-terminal domain-containing protein n=1 Tax=Neobacillus cucumis TaxID=1740721 RepID=UPI0019629BA8|nr:TetR-like C-terminal domain-containing protein [Neobacillus cucumis]